jgi:hypothetical protein
MSSEMIKEITIIRSTEIIGDKISEATGMKIADLTETDQEITIRMNINHQLNNNNSPSIHKHNRKSTNQPQQMSIKPIKKKHTHPQQYSRG